MSNGFASAGRGAHALLALAGTFGALALVACEPQSPPEEQPPLPPHLELDALDRLVDHVDDARTAGEAITTELPRDESIRIEARDGETSLEAIRRSLRDLASAGERGVAACALARIDALPALRALALRLARTRPEAAEDARELASGLRSTVQVAARVARHPPATLSGLGLVWEPVMELLGVVSEACGVL